MSYQTLIVSVAEGVATIRLNRPEALNALNRAMLGELVGCLAAFDSDDAVRAVVLTGSDRAFAAGADVREMAGQSFVTMFRDDVYGAESRALAGFRKPLVAAVAGYALGGGLELALMCDFIIAAETAKFGQPEINLGIVAGMGGTQRLTRLVGKSKAMDMHLTGRLMDAAEAERAGLVSRIVPADRLLAEAESAARSIAGRSMIAAMAVKEAVNMSQETGLAAGLAFERRLFHALFATADQKEGMAAFLDKRAAKFTDG
ncbi:MAG: enoyl-CoA hydratase-related protein [Rhodobacteraceae bacterium]|nr:enoyl-CoA hydratase-related protein [Paracoccaceae bacterium]